MTQYFYFFSFVGFPKSGKVQLLSLSHGSDSQCVNSFPLFLVWFFVVIFLSLCIVLLGLVKSIHPGN